MPNKVKTEEELWEEYRKTSDPKIREQFVKQYAPLVKYVAGKVMAGMPQNIEFEDLVSYGTFGLLDAIEKFDTTRDIKFKTYAITRIRGAIYDELRSMDWVPRSIRQKAKEIESAIVKLETKFGRAPQEDEIAKEMGIDTDEFHQTLMKLSATSLVSINEPVFLNDDSDKVSIIETIESPDSLKPDQIIEKEEVKGIIVKAIEDLPEKEKKVLILYYYEDLTLKEIGEVLNVTESRVSQLHTKAIFRLRAKLNQIRENLVS
jgi:RNA polymerase sigma factor FliA